jgi:hypothetical protein
MTRLAPACQHWRTTSATTSGLVLAACSGVRSQAMLGLRTTTSWRLTKRWMPPRSCRARCTSARGSPPCTTVTLRQLRFGGGAMVAAGLLGLRRDRAEAVLAEPDTRACRARGNPAQAQQLQHGFAPRHGRRRPNRILLRPGGFTGFARSVCFAGHSRSPRHTSISSSDL